MLKNNKILISNQTDHHFLMFQSIRLWLCWGLTIILPKYFEVISIYLRKINSKANLVTFFSGLDYGDEIKKQIFTTKEIIFLISFKNHHRHWVWQGSVHSNGPHKYLPELWFFHQQPSSLFTTSSFEIIEINFNDNFLFQSNFNQNK